jgi:hypothetical protein
VRRCEKIEWASDFVQLSPWFNKFVPRRKKYLTLDLFCNNIDQHEAIRSREEGVVKGDPTLFGNAPRVSGDALSQMWQKGVPM